MPSTAATPSVEPGAAAPAPEEDEEEATAPKTGLDAVPRGDNGEEDPVSPEEHAKRVAARRAAIRAALGSSSGEQDADADGGEPQGEAGAAAVRFRSSRGLRGSG